MVREDDKSQYDLEIRRNSRKRNTLKKTALKQVIQMTEKKYKMFRNTVDKNMQMNLFIIIWISFFFSNFQNNDERKFWKVIRHFRN